MSIDEQRKAAGLSALPEHSEPEPEKQEVVTEDATIGNEERLRGIPAVGRVSGTIKGTRPGDTVRALMAEIDELYEQAIQVRKLAEGQIRRTRRRDHDDRIEG